MKQFAEIFENAYSTKLKSFEPINGGNYSFNFKAVDVSDKAYFVKVTLPKTAERLVKTYSYLKTPLVPNLCFDGKVANVRGNSAMLVYEWHEKGKYIDPVDFNLNKIDSLLEEYEKLSKVMQNAKEIEIKSDLERFDFGLEARVIHGDMHIRNVLFDGDQVSAFVDFELFRKGYPTEDLLRVFIHALERVRFWRLKRIRTIENHFKTMVERSSYPKKSWLAAIDLHEARKSASRRRKAKSGIIADIDAYLRKRFYKKLREIVLRAGA